VPGAAARYTWATKRGELPTIQLAGRLHVPTARLLTMLGYRAEDLPDGALVS
jgi:hypothetical protein